jgi:hypothetical protein
MNYTTTVFESANLFFFFVEEVIAEETKVWIDHESNIMIDSDGNIFTFWN